MYVCIYIYTYIYIYIYIKAFVDGLKRDLDKHEKAGDSNITRQQTPRQQQIQRDITSTT